MKKALSLILTLHVACSSSEPADGVDAGQEVDVPLPCEAEGFPCSLDEETDEAAARADEVQGLVMDRKLAGESYEAIAADIVAESDVVEVLHSESALTFRVQDSLPRWVHTPVEDRREADWTVLASTVAQGGGSLVARPDDDINRDDDKTALIVDPFYWQFGTDYQPFTNELLNFRDYRQARLVRNRTIGEGAVGEDAFKNWEDDNFVWVSTHGDRLPAAAPKYTVLFNAIPCGVTAWASVSAIKLLDNDPNRELTRGSLLGKSQAFVRGVLSADENQELDAFLKEERREYGRAGKTCQAMEHTLGPQMGWMYWQAYDRRWFQRNVGRLDNQLLLLSACSSDSLPVRLTQKTASVGGWSQPVGIADDERTMTRLFHLVFRQGYTLTEAENQLMKEGLNRSMFSMPNALLGFSGNVELRLRESANVIDPETGRPVEGRATFIAAEITPAGNTKVNFDFELLGTERQDPRSFELVVQLGEDEVRKVTPIADRDPDGIVRMSLQVELPLNVRNDPGPHDMIVKLLLPDFETGRGSGTPKVRPFGVHTFEAVFMPPSSSSWQIVGRVAASGGRVEAGSVRAIMDANGILRWSLVLGQSDGSPLPGGNLTLVGHEGRNPDCTGQTGRFGVTVAITADASPEGQFAADPDDATCGPAFIDISEFSQEEGLVATLSGTGCRYEMNAMGEYEPVPVPFSGSINWAQAGCGAPMMPNDPFVGSYVITEEPFVCQDVYSNADFAMGYSIICGMQNPDLTCSEDPCRTANRIGQCDGRNAGAQSFYRGLVWHYYNGFEGEAADIELGCTSQGGVWTPGGM